MTDDVLRSRTIRLLEYLQAVRSLREQPVRDIAEYQERRWWAGDVPAHRACAITKDGGEPWLTVSKATIPAPPQISADVEPYLAVAVNDPQREPSLVPDLDDQLRGEPGEAERFRFQLRRYLDERWTAWAAEAKTALAARTLYEDFYDLRLRLQREEALIELVWGHGVLSWKIDGSRVLHPMVTARAQLTFDATSGDLGVVPDALIGNLEIDVLQGLGIKGFDLLVDIRDRFRTDPVGPFDPRQRGLYEQLLAPLGLDGEVVDGDRPSAPAEAPVITATWGLFVRRRSTLYQRFFGSLREALAAEQIGVPAPLAAIVADEPSKLSPHSGAENESWASVGEQLLMPLPSNAEQENVVRRLTQNRGVTVQGPPGTGKTHSIANLVSHLVGHGKTVLVTSQKEQALSVLRDKIPESIRDLSVAVLGSSARSLSQLDHSVQAIHGRAVALDRSVARAEIDGLRSELDHAQREVGELRTRIWAASSRERDSYTIGTATFSPSTLGHWLTDTEEALGYLPDENDAGVACPLTMAEITELYRFASALEPADCAQARLVLPAPEQLPSGAELATMAADLRDMRDRLADTEGLLEDRRSLDELGSDGLASLIYAVEQGAARLKGLEEPWLESIRSELQGHAAFAATWRAQVKALDEGIEELAVWRGRLLGHQVTLPRSGLPPKEMLEQLETLRDRLASGKGVSKAFHRHLHRLRHECRVDEEPPRSATDVELCIIEARSRRRSYELVNRWNDAVGRVRGPLLDHEAASPEFILHAHVGSVVEAFDWEDGGWAALRKRLVAAGVRMPEKPSAVGLLATAEMLRVAALHFRERDLTYRLDQVRKFVADGASDPRASVPWGVLVDAFQGSSWERWTRAIDDIRRLRALSTDVCRLDELTAQLSGCAPVWTARILQSRGDESVSGSAGDALRAWEWRQAETWLDTIIRGDDPATLQRRLEAKLRTVSKLTGRLASESAWLSVAERLTDAERQALTAWAQALKKVGKGTGKYASKWRAVAQQAMEKAQSAVPVWIMPAYRVVESFDPATIVFDVVIVDESSQCDVFSLAALGMARKAVVVGDDKQISPQAIGIDQGQVHELVTQHVSDLPHSELLDVTSSLYDIAKRTFPGVIMLREHFRCLPEIIEFSNQLSYNGDILPLREQLSDPSWPSVVDIHIPDGYREGGIDTNGPEAEFIVAKIDELCKDTRYDGKTFGVISLLGLGQAALIEHLLIEQLGEQEMERRRIRCGNAYHFQGDERDIMFLSLVVAKNEGKSIGAMTKEADRQRMNVAGSRARDQMWCVRSVSPDELHQDDVRARFIRYCQNPQRVDEAMGELADRCDSEFERDVLRHLLARGYKVKVQHRVGRFRIDLVVESGLRRLAVELDGDAFHGPEQWHADRSRQSILERLGWTFHRIRGSAFYRDPDTALAGLWERLEDVGIRPGPEDPQQPMAPAAYSTIQTGTAALEDTPNGRGSVEVEELVDDVPPDDFDELLAFLRDDACSTDTLDELDDDVLVAGVGGDDRDNDEEGLFNKRGKNPVSTLEMRPFQRWRSRRFPEVNSSPHSAIAAGIVEIVSAEGPVVASRVYELYLRASGKGRMRKEERSALNQAVAFAVRSKAIDQIEDGEPGQANKTLHVPGSDQVVIRRRGDRPLVQIPMTEVVALACQLIAAEPELDDAGLKSVLLSAYELVSVTPIASEFLDRCIRAALS